MGTITITINCSQRSIGDDVVANIVRSCNLHATMLYLLGVDHERLTCRYQGRDFRLTDVAGKVVSGILA